MNTTTPQEIKAAQVKAGDIIFNELFQEPMFQVERVDRARAKGYFVFTGKILHDRYKVSFRMGQTSHNGSCILKIIRGE